MGMDAEIKNYHKALTKAEAEICSAFYSAINKSIPKAEEKVWHGHPVWFLRGNPVVGYSKKKKGIELLFWSGQSFVNEGLQPIGKFMAAGFLVASIEEVKLPKINRWLRESVKIQWDYANLPKKRKLGKLTDF